MPEPSPNVIASTHCVRTPMARAMLRFCATARTLRPSVVFCSTSCRTTNTIDHEQDHVETVVGDRQRFVDLHRARHPARRLDGAVVGAEHVAHHLLQDQAHAERGEQCLERPAVEKTHDAAFDQHADAVPTPGTRPESRRGSTCRCDWASAAAPRTCVYAPSIISSPCAMLITPMTPNVIARPMAASTSTDPGSDRRTASRWSSTRCART